MHPSFTRARRSKLICIGLFCLSAVCLTFALAQSPELVRSYLTKPIPNEQTQPAPLNSNYPEFIFVCGIASAVIGLLLYWHTRPRIILHPRNSIWNPAKLLNKNTSYRFSYRSLKQLETQKSRQSNALIPISDSFALHMSDNSAKLRQNKYKFMTCNTGSDVQALSNKASLAGHRLQQYLPKTYGLTDVCYPCVLKYSEGYASNGVFKIGNENELDEKTRNLTLNKDYVIQEAILDKREYSTQFLVNDGKIVFQCGYYDEYTSRLFIWPRDQSVATSRFLLESHGEEFRIFEEFFKDYTGLINCNYKIKEGRLKVLEFNPRLSGDIYNFRKADLEMLISSYLDLCS